MTDNILALLLGFFFGSCIVKFIYYTILFHNPYKLNMVIGKKGSGKTTLITKMANKYLRKGIPVYSTVYVPGTYLFKVEEVGKKSFPEGAAVFIDEVGMIWDNRQFKNFRPDVRDYFKLQRHRKNTVWLFSQSCDVDLKIRTLVDSMYLVNCYFGWFSVAKKIKREIILTEPDGEFESRLADRLTFYPFWYTLLGGGTRIFTFVPKWAAFFDSFEAPELPPINAVYQDIPERLLKFYRTRKKGDADDKRGMARHWFAKWSDRFNGRKKHGVS